METISRWFEEECWENKTFLLFLLSLRSRVSSSGRGLYLKLDIDSAEKLADQANQFIARLDQIVAQEDPGLSGY